MPDQFDDFSQELRELAASAGRQAEGLPAAEVRSRGARRHRRRAATMVGAGSLALVMSAGGTVAALSGLPSQTPDASAPQPQTDTHPPATLPTSTLSTQSPDSTELTMPDRPAAAVTVEPTVDSVPPTAGWRQAIPAGFDLAQALPEKGEVLSGPSRTVTADPVEACGRTVYPAAAPALDAVGLRHGLDAEYGQQRELKVYRNAAVAHTAVSQIVDAMRACGDNREPTYFAAPEMRTAHGDESYLLLRRASEGAEGGSGQYHTVRVGNAVLFVEYHDQSVPQTAGEQDSMAATAAAVRSVVEDMCVFAADPCAGGPNDQSSVSPIETPYDPELALLTPGDLGQTFWGPFDGAPSEHEPAHTCALPTTRAVAEAGYTRTDAVAEARILDESAGLESVSDTLKSCDDSAELLRSSSVYGESGEARAWLFDHGRTADGSAYEHELLIAAATSGPVQVVSIRYAGHEPPDEFELVQANEVTLDRMAAAD